MYEEFELSKEDLERNKRRLLERMAEEGIINEPSEREASIFLYVHGVYTNDRYKYN